MLALAASASVTAAAPDASPATSASATLDERAVREALADDQRIANAVAARLSRNPALAEVRVDAAGSVVQLSGEVISEEVRTLAETLAGAVDGVIEVDNQLRLSLEVGSRLSDAWRQVKLKMLRLLAATPLLAIAIAIIALASWLGGWIGRRLHLLKLGSRNPYLQGLLGQAVRITVFVAGVLIALDVLGATALVGAVLGSAGVMGIVIGFAFRDLAENQLAGVLLSLRRPFEPGDLIELEGFEGIVVTLNSRATILMTRDGNHVRLPNAMVFKSAMFNYTRNPKRRLTFELGVGNNEDLSEAQRIAIETLSAMRAVLVDPPPRALINEAGDSSVIMVFHAWIDQRETDFYKARSEAIRLVKAALEDAGMDLPEPIYRLQLLGSPLLRGTLTETLAGTVAGTAEGIDTPAPGEPRPAVEPEGDVAPDGALEAQIEAERAQRPSDEDLLRVSGKRE
jgi:small-conductance mechanosensitive channel